MESKKRKSEQESSLEKTFKTKSRKINEIPEHPEYNQVMMEIYKKDPEKKVRVYCDGIFDLFHFGHGRLLEQVKKLGPNVVLVVGVCGDEITHKMKGKTVLTEEERYESVRHCKWVDDIIEDAPWVITQEFLDRHKIDFVAHDGDPYPSQGTEDVYKFVKEQGRFIATQRTDGISTSDIITRIVKDYKQYILRNLKKGYTAKDLNIGFIKEKQLLISDQIEGARRKMKEQWSKNKNIFDAFILHPTDSILELFNFTKHSNQHSPENSRQTSPISSRPSSPPVIRFDSPHQNSP